MHLPTHSGLTANDKTRTRRRKIICREAASSREADRAENQTSRPASGCVNKMMRTILLIILILLLLGALPTWPYSAGWGYYPSGGLGLILLIAIILVLVGRL